MVTPGIARQAARLPLPDEHGAFGHCFQSPRCKYSAGDARRAADITCEVTSCSASIGGRQSGSGSDSVLLVNVQLDRSSLVSGPQRITLRCVPFRAHRQAPEPRRPERHVALHQDELSRANARRRAERNQRAPRQGIRLAERAGVIAALSLRHSRSERVGGVTRVASHIIHASSSAQSLSSERGSAFALRHLRCKRLSHRGLR